MSTNRGFYKFPIRERRDLKIRKEIPRQELSLWILDFEFIWTVCRKREVIQRGEAGSNSEEGGGEMEKAKSSIRTERRRSLRLQINAGDLEVFQSVSECFHVFQDISRCVMCFHAF